MTYIIRGAKLYRYCDDQAGDMLLGRPDGSTFTTPYGQDEDDLIIDPTDGQIAALPADELAPWGMSADTLNPSCDWYFVINDGISLSMGPRIGTGTIDNPPNNISEALVAFLKSDAGAGVLDSEDGPTLHKLIVPENRRPPQIEDFSGGCMERHRALARGEEPEADDEADACPVCGADASNGEECAESCRNRRNR